MGDMMTTIERQAIMYIGDEPIASAVLEELQPRLDDLSNYIGSDIVLVTCHAGKENIPKKVDNRMHIFSMMAPPWVDYIRKKITSYTINEVVCILPPGQRDYIEPTGDEIPGCDGIYDDMGHLMALMIGYNIYILTDCLHCSNKNNLETAMMVFEHIIDSAINLWKECEED